MKSCRIRFRTFLVRGVLLTSFLILQTLNAQTLRRIEVVNRSDSEPIISAEILLDSLRIGLTDENGEFTLSCFKDTIGLQLGYFGQTFSFTVLPTDSCSVKTSISIDLSLRLSQVSVTSEFTQGTSTSIYSTDKLVRAPMIFGQPDILRGLALRSGISHGQEGSANIFVRGGTPDQNLILVDDAPIYNVNHLGGLLSVFNDDAIKSVGVYKTTPPIAYGNRLSSLIDIRLKNGSDQEWRGKLGIGLISANGYIEGPIKKDQTSLIAACRAGYFGLLNIGKSQEEESDLFNLGMRDVLFKITHKFSAEHRLFFSVYHSYDENFLSENVSDVFAQGRLIDRQFSRLSSDYSNTTLSLRHYLSISPSLQWVSFAYGSRYQLNTLDLRRDYISQELIAERKEIVNSQLQEIGVVSQAKVAIGPNNIVAGLSFAYKEAEPFQVSINNSSFLDNPLISNSRIMALFADFQRSLTPSLSMMVGGRFNSYSNQDYKRYYPEFRARVTKETGADADSEISISANRTSQDIHLISAGGLGQTTDNYVLANNDLPLQTGWQVDVTYSTKIGEQSNISVGIYRRNMNNVLYYENPGEGAEVALEIVRKIQRQGKAFSHGIETDFFTVMGKFDFSANYTYSRTKQKFNEFNNNTFFPFRYDRPHDLALNFTFKLSEKYSLGSTFVYQSGIAVTSPISRVPSTPYYVGGFNIVPSINNIRFPAYNRLDLSISRNWEGRKRNNNSLKLSVYNAYNRVNPTYYTSSVIGVGVSDQFTVQTLRVGQFGFLPSIYFSHDFGY